MLSPPALRFAIAADGTVTDQPVTILGPDIRVAADGGIRCAIPPYGRCPLSLPSRKPSFSKAIRDLHTSMGEGPGSRLRLGRGRKNEGGLVAGADGRALAG